VASELVVIGFVSLELPLQIALVPKQSPIEVLATHRPDQSLNERMGTRRTGNSFNLINLEYAKIRQPPMKAKQWIVIRGEVPWRGLLRDRAIEHPEDGGTVEIRRRDAKADDAAGEDVHHDHNPVAFEQNRFAPKEVDAPQAVLSVRDDGEPRGTLTAWYPSVVSDEYASHDIFIDLDRECSRYLPGNLVRQPKRGFRRFISITAPMNSESVGSVQLAKLGVSISTRACFKEK
jgi:hypothetical protein